MNKRPKLKQPTDYPPFTFRLKNAAEKKRIETLVMTALAVKNEKLGSDVKHHTKSEMLLEIVEKGLNKIIND